MGHSTGCQDAMEYVVGNGAADRPKVDGIILQAPVSDPEAASLSDHPDQIQQATTLAQEWTKQGKANDVLPDDLMKSFFGGNVSAYRWLSLLSPDQSARSKHDSV